MSVLEERNNESELRTRVERLRLRLTCRPFVRRFLTNLRHITRDGPETAETSLHARLYEGGLKWVTSHDGFTDLEDKR